MGTNQPGALVSTANVVILQANLNRKYILIQNRVGSANNVYVRFGSPATGGVGSGDMEIVPGSHFEMGVAKLSQPNQINASNLVQPSPNCPTESVNLICLTGSADVAVMEISP